MFVTSSKFTFCWRYIGRCVGSSSRYLTKEGDDWWLAIEQWNQLVSVRLERLFKVVARVSYKLCHKNKTISFKKIIGSLFWWVLAFAIMAAEMFLFSFSSFFIHSFTHTFNLEWSRILYLASLFSLGNKFIGTNFLSLGNIR